MKKPIRIGTRESALALWQAHTLQNLLKKKGFETELVPIKSTGDLDLNQPLYEMGTTGIFTKTLDTALLNDRIDLAIHSMKDVPTLLAEGIQQAAVLTRGPVLDVIVKKSKSDLNNSSTIATGSLRRKAQWLAKYPNHTIVPLRGNIQTRLKKLQEGTWEGAIFAEAALDRLEVNEDNIEVLDWMLPAPAQGALMIVCKSNDLELFNVLQELNVEEAALCTKIERDFLRTLEGGCTAPIGAIATIEKDRVHFRGGVFSLNGKEKFTCIESQPVSNAVNLGVELAYKLLQNGAQDLLKEFKSSK
ncbi:hydroxymethylbilane synthase [Flavobacteriaceae bacterium]|nr:hydroxymethylbilane synthase [Flavobacteriaceae bacterium]MDB4714815.1 hydroxymethylbilane synthase [Flavobacteriaceae bacterium]MDB4773332.1 hydroxymethylbilane synthase [Flavobacteriaceae bacterium]